METKILLLLIGMCLISIFAMPAAVAAEAQPKARADIAELVEQYNKYSEKIPEIIRKVIGTETIRMHITFKDNTTQVIGVKTENALVKEYQETQYPDSTLALYISEDVMEKIVKAKDPFAALLEAWGKEIRYEGLTVVNKIKVFFMDVGVRLFSFFYGFIRSPSASPGGMRGIPITPLTAREFRPREQGIQVDLSDWWSENVSLRETAGSDPIGGVIYIFWLDEDGNICHGDPGITGQPDPQILLPSRWTTVYSAVDEEIIPLSDLRVWQNDTHSLSEYNAVGDHVIHYGVYFWRSMLDGLAIRGMGSFISLPTDMHLGEASITPGTIKPLTVWRWYECYYTGMSLPVPAIPEGGLEELLGTDEEEQDPDRCLVRQDISASDLIEACSEGRLRGSFRDGYFSIVRRIAGGPYST